MEELYQIPEVYVTLSNNWAPCELYGYYGYGAGAAMGPVELPPIEVAAESPAPAPISGQSPFPGLQGTPSNVLYAAAGISAIGAAVLGAVAAPELAAAVGVYWTVSAVFGFGGGLLAVAGY